MTIEERVERLLAKLEALRATDPDRRVFGSSTHGYALLPPIEPAALAAFEAEAGAPLPEEYRGWLLRAGNGGAGPEYGLLPLAPYVSEGFPAVETVITTTDGERFSAGTGDRPPLAAPSSPARPFLLDGRWVPSEPVPVLPPGANPYDGTVQLNEIGCGYLHLLVVHGERSGEVWWDYTAGDGELGPTGRTFLDWMEGWLDRSLVDGSLREIRAAEDGRPRRDEILANEPVFVALAERSPDQPYALASLGWLRVYQGRYDEARAWFERAAGVAQGEDVQAELGRCVASRLAGDPRDVLAAIERARARAPRYVGHTRALIREETLARLALGDLPLALASAEALIRDMPFVDTPHLDKALVLWSSGDPEGADAALVAAAERQSFLMLGEPGDAMLYSDGTPPEERLALLREAFSARRAVRAEGAQV